MKRPEPSLEGETTNGEAFCKLQVVRRHREVANHPDSISRPTPGELILATPIEPELRPRTLQRGFKGHNKAAQYPGHMEEVQLNKGHSDSTARGPQEKL